MGRSERQGSFFEVLSTRSEEGENASDDAGWRENGSGLEPRFGGAEGTQNLKRRKRKPRSRQKGSGVDGSLASSGEGPVTRYVSDRIRSNSGWDVQGESPMPDSSVSEADLGPRNLQIGAGEVSSPALSKNENADEEHWNSRSGYGQMQNGVSRWQAGEAGGTPLRQLPSMDDITRYDTPSSQPAASALKSSAAVVETPRLVDWEKEHSLLGINEAAMAPVDSSVIGYLTREVAGSSSLRDGASPGWDPKRERVYNTMFHVPWRCELLIDVGLCVCLDSFLSLFTVLPFRLLLMLYRRLSSRRFFVRPQAHELCDLARLVVLTLGVMLLQQADVSLLYHWIRGQAIIKLYVVYNVLEILDKLCQSFGADVLQVVFNMADRVATCPVNRLFKESMLLLLDECVALMCFLAHAMIIVSQAVALNVAINSHSNALLTLLVSNNFTEVKGNVFKRLARENVHKMAYLDTVERFHIASCLLFVLVQNIVKGEASLFVFYANAAMVVVCEVLVDLLKHAFLAKFNEIKPETYSDFLLSLCRQTLESRSHHVHRTMSFVPLAPACVVIRGLAPLYLALLPEGPPWWRALAGALLLALSLAAATATKALLALALQRHARWYLLRRLRKQQQQQQQQRGEGPNECTS